VLVRHVDGVHPRQRPGVPALPGSAHHRRAVHVQQRQQRTLGGAARRHDADHQQTVTLIVPEARCPRCSTGILDPGEEQRRCTHCEAVWESGSDAASEYAATVLHLDWYTSVTEGGERPAEDCPDCGEEAVVWDTFDPDADRMGLCFSCGESFNTHCSACNRPMLDSEHRGSGPCAQCWDYYIHRD
jgi:hypothetical protein